jgi:hypothetical protein
MEFADRLDNPENTRELLDAPAKVSLHCLKNGVQFSGVAVNSRDEPVRHSCEPIGKAETTVNHGLFPLGEEGSDNLLDGVLWSEARCGFGSSLSARRDVF